jgi:hypothetical protein
MGKTSKRISAAVIAATIIFLLAGCDNPAMESNETEYMYSDLAIDKAVWEVTSMSIGPMTTLHMYLEFDEPVRSDRIAGSWTPFTVNFDYSGNATGIITSPKTPDIDSSFPRIRGEEKTLHNFSITFNGAAESADVFSNVRLSYMAPSGTKIVGLSDTELKNFMNTPVTKKGADSGMGGH